MIPGSTLLSNNADMLATWHDFLSFEKGHGFGEVFLHANWRIVNNFSFVVHIAFEQFMGTFYEGMPNPSSNFETALLHNNFIVATFSRLKPKTETQQPLVVGGWSPN